MEAARRGDLVAVGEIDELMADLDADDRADRGLQTGLQAREKKDRFARTIDVDLAGSLTDLAADRTFAPRPRAFW